MRELPPQAHGSEQASDGSVDSGPLFGRCRWPPKRQGKSNVARRCFQGRQLPRGGLSSAAEIASINRDLRLSFESDPTRGTLVCSSAEGSSNLTLMQARVYRSLLAMRQLSFDAPLPWTKDHVYRWMTETIDGIRFRADIKYSFCCDPPDTINVLATTIGTPPSRGGAPTDFRQIESFLGLIVHESRHRNRRPHSCGNKDTTLKELGAWAAHYYFHLWVADHAPDFISPSMRDEFRTSAVRICQEQFCEDRCPDRVEEVEYAVISAAAAQVGLPLGVRLLLVSDRTVSFPCESGAETGLVIGDCNGSAQRVKRHNRRLRRSEKAHPR